MARTFGYELCHPYVPKRRVRCCRSLFDTICLTPIRLHGMRCVDLAFWVRVVLPLLIFMAWWQGPLGAARSGLCRPWSNTYVISRTVKIITKDHKVVVFIHTFMVQQLLQKVNHAQLCLRIEDTASLKWGYSITCIQVCLYKAYVPQKVHLIVVLKPKFRAWNRQFLWLRLCRIYDNTRLYDYIFKTEQIQNCILGGCGQ